MANMMDSASQYQKFIFNRTYARWSREHGRRETWDETVDRYTEFMVQRVPKDFQKQFRAVANMIRAGMVMPSMRALWTAGPALARENVCGYNCAALNLDHPKAFAELLYILLCGTGVGYSVERQVINRLRPIPDRLEEQQVSMPVADSKRGWAEAFYTHLCALWDGKIFQWDLSKVRPAGAPLKTFGGRASGPRPLRALLDFATELFRKRVGTKLTSVDCADLANKAAESVVVGGVRRSACICLTNLSDDRMAKYKTGNFQFTHPHRQMANISVAYTDEPDSRKLLSEWVKLIESNSGERGIFNRGNVNDQIPSRRKKRDDWLLNPCGEIILRPHQFCNLSEVVVRPTDNLESLQKKVQAATILGMVQGTLTDFRFLRKVWTDNTREEHLLGVSLTGLADNPHMAMPSHLVWRTLRFLREIVLDTARSWSTILGVPMPAAATCVKPSGTVSQLVNSSSGLHSRYAPYYLRRVRVAVADPICQYLMDAGVPNMPEVGQVEGSCNTRVFEFPERAPQQSRLNNQGGAIFQLRYWAMLKTAWCEHNPSCTIFVKESEWIRVLAWIKRHWSQIGGLAFLPANTGSYQLAPLEEIDAKTYRERVAAMPVLDFTNLVKYESVDQGGGAAELACTAGSCAF